MLAAGDELGFMISPEIQSGANIFIIIKNPLTRRDYDRICTAKLEREYNVKIFDCTQFVFPAANRDRGQDEFCPHNLIKISSYRELRRQLEGVTSGFLIDYVGNFSVKTVMLFRFFKRKGISLVVVDSGPIPAPNFYRRRAELLSSGWSLIWERIVSKILFLIASRLFDLRADIAIVSGTSWKAFPRYSLAHKIIPAHSFDYEEYLQQRMLPKIHAGEYAVYLDEDIANHRDNLEWGYPHPVTEGKFFNALRRFFYRFERETGMPVVVAACPSAQYCLRPDLLRGTEVVTDATANLISGASFVFAHASTAISFPIIWRCPLVFLTSDEIGKSWYYPRIEYLRKILNGPMVNIDLLESNELNVAQWKAIDESAYQDYRDTYIKSKSSPEISLWTIFLNTNLEVVSTK